MPSGERSYLVVSAVVSSVEVSLYGFEILVMFKLAQINLETLGDTGVASKPQDNLHRKDSVEVSLRQLPLPEIRVDSWYRQSRQSGLLRRSQASEVPHKGQG